MKRVNRFAKQDFEGKSTFEMGSFISRNQLHSIDMAMNGEVVNRMLINLLK